jgi:PAS domain S-box-containing protein
MPPEIADLAGEKRNVLTALRKKLHAASMHYEGSLPQPTDELRDCNLHGSARTDWCTHVSDLSRYSGEADGQSITTLALQHEHDLILLRRTLRTAGDDLNFDDRDIARLSAAAYEAARQLFSARQPATAEILVSRLPRAAVRVVVRAGIPDASVGRDTTRRLEKTIRSLDALVDHVTVESTDDDVAVVLVTHPAGGPAARADAMDLPMTADDASCSDAEIREQFEHAQSAMRDMQIELQETNRGVVAVYAELEDQTERVRQAEDRLRMLLDGVHDYAICMLGPDGEIASWNVGGERIFGFSADEIIGRNYACFFPPVEREEGLPEEHLKQAFAEGRHEIEGIRVRRGGSAFDASVVITPMRRPSGQHRGFSLVIRDITERKRLEDDLRRRAEDLDAANRAKEDFLATLSHELRTPLNAMLGWARLLRMGRLDPATTERALETIERNAHIQEQLIADILDVSRIVTGKLRLNLRPIDLTPVLDGAVEAVRATAEAKGVVLDVQVEPPGVVHGDPDRLQQVMWNLLSNAVKFTPSGGTVTISSGRVGANAMIRISDTGEGMAPELLPYVFDRFRQGDASATRSHGGLGLGLAIVRHIIELHGGQVQAWSEGTGRGSSFAVQLPVRAVQNVEDSRPDIGSPLAGLKILVVDDEADAREVVATALAQCGARTVAVATASEAIQLLKNFHPDVVVSDISMPGEDGYSLVRKIRSMKSEIAGVPVVALTAFTQPEEGRRAIRAGFKHCVSKPVEIDELAAVVRTVADRR